MDGTSGTPTALVVAAVASAIAAFLTFGVAALVPYLNWRGSDRWRRRRALRLVRRPPKEVHHWSLRFNVWDAFVRFSRHRTRANRKIRKLDRLYECPRLPRCEHPTWCEACERIRGPDGEYQALLMRALQVSAEREQTYFRRRGRCRPWRRTWMSRRQRRRLNERSDAEPLDAQ